MLLKELLDKQLEWTCITVISEEYDCRGCAWASRARPYVDGFNRREEIYDKYGDREVEYFYHSLCKNNKGEERVSMNIKLVKQS